MTFSQQIITIILCSIATALIRYLPFVIFSDKRQTPSYIVYLGNALPGAIFAMLIIYCLKDVNVLGGSHGLPELIAIALTVLVHLRKRKTLLSIATGTLVYMLLIHFLF
ncbi:MAG: AzlD domain-containing protein [Erysipelotrichaceae bacterium]|nr:AzlD domain-containing protein [Erysipelotrichaceae bacterium]